jgi:hypothetical protein
MKILVLLALAACGPRSDDRLHDPFPRLFAELDRDGDGSLSRDELRTTDPDDLLPRLDRDGDGAVSPDELRADVDAWPEDQSVEVQHGLEPGAAGAHTTDRGKAGWAPRAGTPVNRPPTPAQAPK